MKKMLTEEQMLQRRLGIGGSDVAAILGRSQYKTAVEVYLDKLGISERKEMTENQRDGHIMEPVILNQYEEYTGKLLFRSPPTKFSELYPWMFGNLDAITGDCVVVDAKYMNSFSKGKWGEPGTDAMPDDVFFQMVHYAIVYDASRVDVAVFFDRPKLFVYTYERNKLLEEKLINIEKKFWHDHVLARIPPPITVPDDARELWPRATNDSIKIATDEAINAWNELRHVKETIKEAESKKKFLEAKILQCIEDNEILTDPSGFTLATWKNQSSDRFNQTKFGKEFPELLAKFKEKSISRVLRINMKD